VTRHRVTRHLARRLGPVLFLLPLTGCLQKPPPPALHYVVGNPYQADGVWQYPEADFTYDMTGIAAVQSGPHPRFTADGELFSPRAFAAAHPTLQLPAIARVTSLDNGRQIVVRINDRGPANPARIIAVTPRVATLLGFDASGTARVRVRVLPGPSEQIALSLPGGPSLAIAPAPVGAVAVTTLPVLAGTAAATAAPRAAGPSAPGPSPAASAAPPPDQQPGALSEVPPAPGSIWVRTGLFTGRQYAALQAASLARFGAAMVPRYGGGTFQVEVRIGPFASITEADAMLNGVLRTGVTGARLVVE
jgi:peptidoglycan lytic transglycosylase